jgi:hypothetical protein
LNKQFGFLQCQDNYLRRLLMGPRESDFAELSYDEKASLPNDLPMIGFYGSAGPHMALLYRIGEALRIKIDNDAPITISHDVSAIWALHNRRVSFSLLDHGKPVKSLHYEPSIWILEFEHDYTPLAEPEHFDMLLFISNVIRDEGRQSRLFRNSGPE